MILQCLCGTLLDDIGYPNDIECFLVSTRSQERLQDLVDQEVAKDGEIQMWPEHWEDSNSPIVWKCHSCNRLYLNAEGEQDEVIVYNIEQKGI